MGILLSIVLLLMTQGSSPSTFFCQSDYDRFILDFTTDSGFFIYLFLCRCIPFYLLIALTFKTRRKIFCHLYFWYIGFIYGTVGLLSAFEYGITGLILCIFRLLPQVCFYVPALYATWRMTAGFTDHLLPINKRLLVIGLLLWTIGTAVEWAFNPRFTAIWYSITFITKNNLIFCSHLTIIILMMLGSKSILTPLIPDCYVLCTLAILKNIRNPLIFL